jgi:hypothetical protein
MQGTFVKYLPTPSDSEFSQPDHLTSTFPAEPVLLATDSAGGAGGGGKRERQKEDTDATGKNPSSSPQPMGKAENEEENNAGEKNDQEEGDQLPGLREKDGYFKSDMMADTGTGNV